MLNKITFGKIVAVVVGTLVACALTMGLPIQKTTVTAVAPATTPVVLQDPLGQNNSLSAEYARGFIEGGQWMKDAFLSERASEASDLAGQIKSLKDRLDKADNRLSAENQLLLQDVERLTARVRGLEILVPEMSQPRETPANGPNFKNEPIGADPFAVPPQPEKWIDNDPFGAPATPKKAPDKKAPSKESMDDLFGG